MANSHPTSLLRDLVHELRDALSPVRSALDLMRLRNFSADASRAVAGHIEQGLDRAIGTLDAFVLADQCDNGTATVTVSPVSLSHLLGLAVEALPAQLRARCRVEPPPPDIEVLADTRRTLQVLSAMMRRVAVMVPEGTALEVGTAPTSEGIELHVAVSGGQPSATEEWFGSYRSPPGAPPLALRTARALMRLQQGDLEVRVPRADRMELVARWHLAPAASTESVEESAGAARAASDAVDVAGKPAAAGVAAGARRLLMVEDNAEVRRAYREALMAMGYEVREARTAEEALAAVAVSAPEIVLIDINLPGMNGYRLAQTLKARAASPLRLVMLSGVTLDEMTLQLSRQAGFDQCFDKAAGPKALHALLTSVQ